jgi:hypothetical protein
MPSGKRENFRVILLLDRTQRKLLDRIIDVCNIAMHHAVRQAMHTLETTKLVTPLDEFERLASEFVKDCNPPIFEETKKRIAQIACDVYANMVAGDIETRRRRDYTLICAIPPREVIFSSSGRQVKVPYLGVVNYRRNMFAVTSEGGVHIPQTAHRMILGYLNNEPCLVLMTVEPPKEQAVIGKQKLVKLTTSEIARRRKGAGKAAPPDQEPK